MLRIVGGGAVTCTHPHEGYDAADAQHDNDDGQHSIVEQEAAAPLVIPDPAPVASPRVPEGRPVEYRRQNRQNGGDEPWERVEPGSNEGNESNGIRTM